MKFENERPLNEGPVLRNWVTEMPWKMQSALLSSLRGPDSQAEYTKRVVMFLRVASQNDARSGQYMPTTIEPLTMEAGQALLNELVGMPVHYVLHLLLGLQVVGIRHPDSDVRLFAGSVWGLIEEDWHLTLDDVSTRLA